MGENIKVQNLSYFVRSMAFSATIQFVWLTSQQNRVAESINMTLVQRTRSIRLNAGLLNYFFTKSINLANFVNNKLLHAIFEGRVVGKVWIEESSYYFSLIVLD